MARNAACLFVGVALTLLMACSAELPTPLPPTATVMSPSTAAPSPVPATMPVPTNTPEHAITFRVVGYVTDWGAPVTPEQIGKLTHINYAFALPNEDGTVSFPANEWKLQQYVQLAHERGVKVLLSVGGWGLDPQFEAFAGVPERRAVFAKALMDYVDKNNLDGVDIDWEYPKPGTSAENFAALMQELRGKLDAKGKLLTTAVAAYGDYADGFPEETFNDADFLNVMAYADSGAHHSTYEMARRAVEYWRGRGLAQDKLVLGVPFYAQPGDTPYRKVVASDETAAQTDFAEYLGQVVAYNGLPTMRAKTRLAMEQGSGLMIWTVGDDSMGMNSLLNAIHETAAGTSSELPPLPFGAGFRFSTYGPPYDPGPEYWADFAQEMVGRFEGARPQVIWIVGNLSGQGTQLTFFGKSDSPLIHFSSKDRNEEALTRFDEIGAQVWLQVEPGNAPVEKLIEIVLNKYKHHPSVVGVGVDVEWHKSIDAPEGEPVTDGDARLWRETAQKFNPTYRLFLKHWEIGKMPQNERAGIVFVDDSQQFSSLDAMAEEFETWGEHFAPAQVAFQIGYPDDKKWWGELDEAPVEIGERIRARVPNLAGVYWVDFTALEVFKPE